MLNLPPYGVFWWNEATDTWDVYGFRETVEEAESLRIRAMSKVSGPVRVAQIITFQPQLPAGNSEVDK